jgi:hypothetical protein
MNRFSTGGELGSNGGGNTGGRGEGRRIARGCPSSKMASAPVGIVGGNRARRVDADTTTPKYFSLPSPAITRLILLLWRRKEKRKTLNSTGNEIRKMLSRPKTERLAEAFGALFSLQCVRFITRGSLFIGDPWVWSFASITPFSFLTNGFKHFTRV